MDDKKDSVVSHYLSTSGGYVIAFTVPVTNNNELVGTISIDIKLGGLTEYIESLSDNNNFFVTTAQGTVFASRNEDEIGKNIFELIPAFEQYSNQENAEFDFVWEAEGNKKYTVYSTSLGELDWKLWQYEEYDKIEAKGTQYLVNSIIYLSIFLVLALIIIYIVANRIARPLAITFSVITMLAVEGATNHEPDHNLLKRKGEIGDLERAVNLLITILKKKAVTAKGIASGNLRVDVSVLSQKDDLGLAFEQMVRDLNGILSRVSNGVVQVNSGASQISDSSQSLSQGATEQAAAIEEITLSMTELSSQTAANAENAHSANKLASETATAAETEQERMNKLTAAMTQISSNAEETQNVIKTIDDIAFQTNLLALNAAVEAARAGIHGKGFAVVAEEVRNLAARSAKAAAETADLIQNSNNQINEGVVISEQTAEALNAISANVNQTTETIKNIATASSEQASGISQINTGLGQIDKVTQQNTANAEETASASEEMSSQAETLQSLVGHFKLKDLSGRQSAKGGVRTQQVKPLHTPQPKVGSDKWGTQPNTANSNTVRPTDQIVLDDNEFDQF